MKRTIIIGALALTVAACGGTSSGPFVPTATLDPTQVEVVTPAPQIVVPVTPQQCLDAIDGLMSYVEAQDAILEADDAVYQALVDNNQPALKRAVAAREAAITNRNAIDLPASVKAAQDCYGSAK